MSQAEFQGFRLSPQQRRLWSLQQAQASMPYRVRVSVSLEGEIDPEVLKEALQQTVLRHEVLRTTFRHLPGMEFPVQVINDEPLYEFSVYDFSQLPVADRETSIDRLWQKADQIVFDLAQGPLLHASLIRLCGHEHQLQLCLPALSTDEAGLVALVRELAGELNDDSPLQYADISEVLNDLLESEETAAGRAYWLQPDLVAIQKFPFDEYPDFEQAFSPRSLSFMLTPDLTGKISEQARAYNVSPAILLQACWHILLSRMTGEEEITVSAAFSGRVYEGLDHVPGLFARYLPISSRQTKDQQLRDVLGQLRQAANEANEQQDYFDYERVAQLNSIRPGQPFFFPLGFEFVELSPPLQVSGVKWTVRQQIGYTDRFPLKLRCVANGGEGLRAEFQYDPARVEVKTIERLARSYRTLLSNILQTPNTRLGELEILDDEQRREILVEFNQTATAFAPPYCIHEAIEQQRARTPHGVAVRFEQHSLSYSELDDRANQLARYLRRKGAGPETLVGVLFERSLEMMVGLLGVLKAGAAYLPLDPEQPPERLKRMIEDGQPKLLLTHERFLTLANEIGSESLEILSLDSEWETFSGESTASVESGAGPENVAYVIYTSGSTGQPKGVAITHEAICNRLLWMQEQFPLRSGDRVLQKTVYSFDASVWELFLPLMTGASVVLAAPGAQRDSAALVAALQAYEVTVLQMVPSMLAVLVEERGIGNCGSLQRVFSGGEALTESLQERFYERVRGVELINLYGPTEASIDASYYVCERGRKRNKVLIGRPISNMQLYLLDEQQQVAPVGTAGELYIGGVGLARGYWQQASLTAERFVPHGFSRAGERLYRTGDIGRYLSDGTIEYLGRVDHQVKVRGVRIELGEIKTALLRQPGVRDVVVVAHDDISAGKRLVAYVVSSNHGAAGTSPEELRRALRDKLPDYMVPQSFVMLEQLPLLANGKVNLRALPAPEGIEQDEKQDYVAPLTPVEGIVADICANALRVARVGRYDNFFELGGHSLSATQVVSRIRQVFQIELPLKTLFDEPTVHGLSRSIELARGSVAGSLTEPIQPVARDTVLPLSFAQHRMWFLHQLEPESAAYNVASAIRLEGTLNLVALQQSLDVMLARHEALRTIFTTLNGQPIQLIQPPQPAALQITDLQDLSDAERSAELRRLMDQEVNRPFDLSRGPLLRVLLWRLGVDEYVMLLTMHHIVSDGWSLGVLVRELSALYEAFARGEALQLPELSIQYADFAVWQHRWLQGEVLDAQLNYWRRQLADAPAVVEIPADRPRPSVQTFHGVNHYLQIDPNTTQSLRELSRREAVSLFMTMVAAFQLLVKRHGGQDHVVIGTDVANRNRQEIEGLIGFFANQLVLHTDLSGNPTFRELLTRVREVTLEAYAHQDLPFEKLVEELRPERDSSRTPLFQLKIVMQNAPLPVIDLTGLRLFPEELGGGTAKFDLTLFLEDTPQGLNCTWQYNSDLFTSRTIHRLATSFARILEQVAREPNARLDDLIATLNETEKEERSSEKKKLAAANLEKFKLVKSAIQ